METSTNYSKTADVRRADKSENITLFRNVYPVSYTHLTLPTICSV